MSLTPHPHPPRPISRFWLLLGTLALAIAGLFSLVLVVARTPQLSRLPGFSGLFHQALVVHVDLSVLVWFLCIACLMWSMMTSSARRFIPYLEESALLCFALGMAAMALSPLDSEGEAMMSNYIPVIHSPVFFVGLALVGCGTALMLARVFTGALSLRPPYTPLHFALLSAAAITVCALVVFYTAFARVPPVIDGQQYYEMLFWGGGHILQFTHTQILMVCWLLLAVAVKPDFRIGNDWLYGVFGIGLLAALLMVFAAPADVASQAYRQFFTDVMIWAGGIAPCVLALFVLPVVWCARKEKNALWSSLAASLLLFIYGGILAGMIQGQNVVIPAHYHGSIVGVTLAFMGMAYALLPGFGYRDVSKWRLAYWQPIVYGGGQLMHISGLAWSGGYGVLRKTPGAAADIAPSVKAALGFMGMGGLLAIIGGLMFVVVMYKAVRKA